MAYAKARSMGPPGSKVQKPNRPLFPIMLLATTGLGVAMVLLGVLMSEQRNDLWIESAKVGIQLLAVGIVGGGLSAGWKTVEQQRSDRRKDFELILENNREVHERQLATFVQVVTAYNGVKSVRRTLKSLGLTSRTGALDNCQVTGFHTQMSRLNELQLVFEAMVREFGETDLFSSDTPVIIKELSGVGRYLNKVLALWEDHGAEIREGSSLQAVANGLAGLLNTSMFTEGVVQRRRRVTETMHRHLFGIASAATLGELAQLEALD